MMAQMYHERWEIEMDTGQRRDAALFLWFFAEILGKWKLSFRQFGVINGLAVMAKHTTTITLLSPWIILILPSFWPGYRHRPALSPTITPNEFTLEVCADCHCPVRRCLQPGPLIHDQRQSAGRVSGYLTASLVTTACSPRRGLRLVASVNISTGFSAPASTRRVAVLD